MPKAGVKSKREVDSDTSDSGPDDTPPRKSQKTKSDKTTGSAKNNADAGSCKVIDGEPTWELTPTRLVKIRKFKGNTYVDIREYYEAQGKIKPGKKGVCLSMSQWDMLTQIVDEVNDRL